MPPREPALPEGTDHVIRGASGSSAKDGGGFVASAGDSGGGTDRLVKQVREQVSTIKSQATTRIRGIADEGKESDRPADDFSEVIGGPPAPSTESSGEELGQLGPRAPAPSPPRRDVPGKSVDY